MKKQTLHFEWQIVESDTDWERLHAAPLPDAIAATLPGQHRPRSLATAVVLLLLLAAIGGWWQAFHAEVQQTSTGVKATTVSSSVAVEQCSSPTLATPAGSRSDADVWYHSAQKYNGLFAEPINIPLGSDQTVAAVGMGCAGESQR